MKKVLILQIPILIVLVGAWVLRNESQFFVIQDIPVEIEFEQGQKPLIESLKPEFHQVLKGLKGANIWKVSLGRIQQKLLDNPWVDEVELRRSFPRKISALVKLNSVALLYIDKKNRIHPITVGGKKLKPVKASVVPVAPILRNSTIVKDQEKLRRLVDLLKEVPNLGALKKENIAQVDFKPVTGLTLGLIGGGEKIHLGEQDISTKGLQVLRVTDYLKSQKQKARVIDASFSKKVLVRLRKRS